MKKKILITDTMPIIRSVTLGNYKLRLGTFQKRKMIVTG